MPDTTTNRLTDDDRRRIAERLADITAGWARRTDGRPIIPGHEVTTSLALTRSACHAIGCSAHDLRDAELVEIADTVAAHLAPLVDEAGTVYTEPGAFR